MQGCVAGSRGVFVAKRMGLFSVEKPVNMPWLS